MTTAAPSQGAAHTGGWLLRAAAAATLVAFALLSQLPQHMFHWDEFQLSYAVERFDLRVHEPHPPGYLWFVMLGRLLQPLLGGDSTLALRVVSVLAAAGFAGMVAARLPRTLPASAAWALSGAAAVFVIGSPLLWFFSLSALTYVLEGAIWTALLLALCRHSRLPARAFMGIAFVVGLSGGLRPTLLVWGSLLLGAMALRLPATRTPLALGRLTGSLVLGALCWVLPLLQLAGGLEAYRTASGNVATDNIWAKSLFVAGGELVFGQRLPQMLSHLLMGVGALLLVASGLLLARIRRRTVGLAALDLLPIGALLAFGFYGLLIYDTPGYMAASVMPLGAYAVLGGAEVASTLPAPRALALSLLLLLAASATPWLARAVSAQGTLLEAHDGHDAMVNARAQAVAARFDPATTVLVTSMEYRSWGLRHVGHALPQFVTVQIAQDPLFAITSESTPYLATRQRRLRAVGPYRLELASLLGDGDALRQVVYMMPQDATGYIDASCQAIAAGLRLASGEVLPVLSAPPQGRIWIEHGKLHCDR